jgi:hypothetical protein
MLLYIYLRLERELFWEAGRSESRNVGCEIGEGQELPTLFNMKCSVSYAGIRSLPFETHFPRPRRGIYLIL